MWDPRAFIEEKIEEIRKIVKGKALVAVSGGVDSTTSAIIAYRALGELLKPVFIDTGFMRPSEPRRVPEIIGKMMPLKVIDGKNRFYRALKGLEDAEEKRIAFRKVFYEILLELIESYECSYLIQGTIAPDVIETLGGIKTQHNVLDFYDEVSRKGIKVVEPLRELYKDQVRTIAEYLGLPKEIVYRQPFPGPGLLIRCIGEFALEKLDVVRRATMIVEEELAETGASQYFAAATINSAERRSDLERSLGEQVGIYEVNGVRVTGVKGDVRAYGKMVVVENEVGAERWQSLLKIIQLDGNISRIVVKISGSLNTGGYIVLIRAVDTEDYMTARVHNLEKSKLLSIAKRIEEEVPGATCICYDITPKPPATIEYE